MGDSLVFPPGKRSFASMKKRKVYRGVLNHCYQRTVDRIVLFYTVSDYLLYFTIFCITVSQYRVRILKLVLMPDHIHQAVIEEKGGEMSRFERDCHKRFAREYNKLCSRSGPLFEHHYGSAPKYENKRARSSLIYLDNNPVERKLAVRAEEYQWSFLAYANSDHPFSEKILLRKASPALRRALKEVRALHKAGRFLPYAMLQRLFKSLRDDCERKQLTDFIIVTYSVIDHKGAIQYFGSFEDELTAAHATSGSEYDIKESFDGVRATPIICLWQLSYAGRVGTRTISTKSLHCRKRNDSSYFSYYGGKHRHPPGKSPSSCIFHL